METGRHWKFGFLIGLAMTTAGVGCMLNQDEDVTDDGSEINEGSGDVSQVLKSTLILDQGCTAVKVGPNHLLTTARCVADKNAFASGKTITFKVASGATQGPPNLTAIRDAGSDDDADADTTTTTKTNKSMKEATIDEVKINPSWNANCAGTKCPVGSVAASEAKDIAVIVLDAELSSIPTVKVDLDEVGQNDPVLAVGSGCAKIDGTPSTVKTIKTLAVAPASVNHRGSPYVEAKEKVGGLNSAYVVTPGSDWKGQDGPSLCLSDLGAPLFRANAAVVAGITASYTTFETGNLVAVTVEHTRVDTKSNVGKWLGSIKGIETTHSCSESTAGCVDHGKFDGGVPTARTAATSGTTSPGDAGDDALAPPPKKDPKKDDSSSSSNNDPGPSGSSNLGDEQEDPKKDPNDGTGIDAGAKKKKKAAEGCTTAAPGASRTRSGTNPLPGFAIVLGMTISLASLRRRRRKAA